MLQRIVLLFSLLLLGCSDSVERVSKTPPPEPTPNPDNTIKIVIPGPTNQNEVLLYNDYKPDTDVNLSLALNASVNVPQPYAINYGYCIPYETHYKRVSYDNYALTACLSMYTRKNSFISDFLPRDPIYLSASLFFEVYHELIHAVINNHPKSDVFYNVYGEQDIYALSIVAYLNMPNMSYLSGDILLDKNRRAMEILYAMFYSATILTRPYTRDAYEVIHKLDANYSFVICGLLAYDLTLEPNITQWFTQLSFDPSTCSINKNDLMTTYNDINRIYKLFKTEE